MHSNNLNINPCFYHGSFGFDAPWLYLGSFSTFPIHLKRHIELSFAFSQ